MLFPIINDIARSRDMTTVFGGYNHRISCQEGQFYDMKNMTSSYFPMLSPRGCRGNIKTFTNPQGMLDKEDLWWIDNKCLYKNGLEMHLEGVSLSDEAPKTIAKMGAYIIIMPDRIWCNTVSSPFLECGYMENRVEFDEDADISFSICGVSGNVIEWHDETYYKENPDKVVDGCYKMTTTSSGKPSLKQYSATTKIWSSIASTYIQISAEGIGEGFDKEDGITLTATGIDESLSNIFVNDEGEGKFSTSTYIIDRTDDSITIPGLFSGAVTSFKGMTLKVERKVPDMAFITECNNRLWGCSKDGHEIYACKLGDVKNWYCYRGSSTDSWAATIGSDGKFTGAITFGGYPIFFKEDSLLKIAISTTGGHATKETKCRGVQSGSHGSLSILNEVLYYKSASCVCGYNGSLPYSISDDLGDDKYYDAVAGSIGDRYYISMCDRNGKYSLFCFDVKNGIWCKEDNVKALAFCRYKDDLFFIDAGDGVMKSVGGTLLYFDYNAKMEDKVDWFVESGPIGYSSPDYKYIGRINLRITLEFGTNVDFYIQYDSCGEWEHKFSMSGTGTRTYSIPFIPRRCDHFKYKISGKGGCKIISVTKTIEEGSDG
jgi:hypothetical protein